MALAKCRKTSQIKIGGFIVTLLQDMFQKVVLRHGEKVAFDSLEDQITYSQLHERIKFLAGALRDLGIGKGEKLAILAQNCTDYISYHYALACIGAVLVPLNIRHTDHEMLWMLNDAETAALIVDEDFKSQLPLLRSHCSTIRFTIGIGSVDGTDYGTGELIEGKIEPNGGLSISSKDPVLLIYTSGTTGKPKGAFQNHQGICMMDALTSSECDMTEEDVYLAFMPYFHQAGLLRTRAVMMGGGQIIVPGKINVEQMANLFEEKGVTIAIFPVAYYRHLTDIADSCNFSFPSLRLIIGLGGMAPLQAKEIKNFCERFNCIFRGVYGQTECSGPVTFVMGDQFFKNPLTCGKPRKGIEVEIWDDLNNPVPVGTVGEIVVRGRNTIPGYWKNPQADQELYTGNWLHTGDLGRFDEENFLYFVDRKKELVKTGGENVYPTEVEQVLKEHPAVSDLTVIGLPDPGQWGEVVTAVVVLKEGAHMTLDEMKAFCKNKIAGYKIPKVLKIVRELPRNITGKVKKLELRERFAGEQ